MMQVLDGTETFQRARYEVYKDPSAGTYAKYVTELVKYGFPERQASDNHAKDLNIAQEARKLVRPGLTQIAQRAIEMTEKRQDANDGCSFRFKKGQKVYMMRMTDSLKRYNGKRGVINGYNEATRRYYVSPSVSSLLGVYSTKFEIPNVKCFSLRPA